jgi:hypothetical protein
VPLEEIPEPALAELEAVLTEEPAAAEAGEAGEEEVTAEEAVEEVLVPPRGIMEPEEEGKPQLRFAEDIMVPRRPASSKSSKTKKKKKGTFAKKESSEDAVKVRKGGRRDYETEEDEEYF